MKKEENAVIKMKSQKIKKTMDKDNLIIGIVVGIVVLLTVALVSYYFCFAGSEELVSYDDGEVTREEYEIYYKSIVPTLVYYYGYNPADLATYIAENAVSDEVAYKKAIEAGFDESKISKEDKEYIDQNFESEDSLNSIRKMGLDPEKVKDVYYKQAIVSTYMEDLETKVTVDEMKAYLKETEGEKADFNIYNTRHILLLFKEDMTDKEKADLLKKAKDLLAKAKKGEDFAKLAKENSDDSSAQEGGVVPITNNNTVYEEYMNAVLKLKAGKIYDSVVETQAGYHIIKLDSIDKEGRLTDENEIATYVNAKFADFAKEANYEIDEERVKTIAADLAIEMGLVATENTETEIEETTETEKKEDTKKETETKTEEK